MRRQADCQHHISPSGLQSRFALGACSAAAAAALVLGGALGPLPLPGGAPAAGVGAAHAVTTEQLLFLEVRVCGVVWRWGVVNGAE